jgi:hypothetical protein
MRPAILFFACVVLVSSHSGHAAKLPILDNDAYLLVGPGPLNWNCNAPAGKFNQVHGDAVSDHFLVTGNLHLVAMNPVQTYGSGTLVGFYDRKTEKWVGLQLLANYLGRENVAFALVGDKYPAAIDVFTSQPNKESDFPFTLRLDQGTVSISVAGMNVTSKHPKQGLNGVTFSCSGAHVQFTNVAITSAP